MSTIANTTTTASVETIAPEIRRRQEALLAQARRLRARFGPPERRLAALHADLPPADDSFWIEVLEAT